MPASLEPLDPPVRVPSHFRCPISLDLMADPVTLSTGHTYDRCSIESWIATGNNTCPVTRSPLTDFTLIPNHTLRRLIQDWCVANRSFGVQRIPTPKQPPDPVLVRNLLNQASSLLNSVGLRVSALRRLRALGRDSEKNRSVIVGAADDAPSILMPMVFADVDSGSEVSDLNLEALAVLSMFPLAESECLFVAKDVDRVAYLVNLLFHPSIDVRVNSAAVIEAVVAGTRSPELRSRICGVNRVFVGVVGILSYPLFYARAVKVGIKALFALCLVKQHRHTAVAAGAVEALVDRIAELQEKCDVERALATVELLCRIPSGCTAFASHALTVPLLVKIILKISDRATEYAAGALLSLCTAEEQSQRESVAAGVLTQLLLLVQSECTERAKRKAQMLLKLLRDSWPQHSDAYSRDFSGNDVVTTP